VDAGEVLVVEAEFEEALVLFDRAEAGVDLSRADLVRLVSARCLVRFAMDDGDGLSRDLTALASLAPDHRWGAEAPPEITSGFRAARRASTGPIEVLISHRPVASGVWLDAVVAHDDANLVREVRLFSRTHEGAYRRAAPGPRAVPPGVALQYYAELIGPGGAVIANVASPTAPDTTTPALDGLSAPISEDGNESRFPWLYVGVGVGAAILVAVLTAVLTAVVTNQSTDQSLRAPVAIGF